MFSLQVQYLFTSSVACFNDNVDIPRLSSLAFPIDLSSVFPSRSIIIINYYTFEYRRKIESTYMSYNILKRLRHIMVVLIFQGKFFKSSFIQLLKMTPSLSLVNSNPSIKRFLFWQRGSQQFRVKLRGH